MAKTIHLAVKHELGVAGAKQAITDRFALLNETYIQKIGSAAMRWEGDTAHVAATALGQKASAIVAVREAEITIDIALPWLLAGMAGTIESILTSNKDALQRKPPPA